MCGSLAVYLARHGATSITVLARSGYDDEKSQTVLRDLKNLGAQVDTIIGDVTRTDDVERAFQSASKPIRGVIAGAMLLRVSISAIYLSGLECSIFEQSGMQSDTSLIG